jgi:3'-phosphoadenosine 5'-phosphosulfate sulfotransferase (PAPS reductase)/FAD synthetase
VTLTHLQQLESESIHIMREVVAQASKPVMLYSIGKDSSVMLHLACKAFYPAPPPLSLLHFDTPLDLAEKRDPKGIYMKARSGQLKNFTGIDSPYEAPEHPEVILSTSQHSAEELAKQLCELLQRTTKYF